jgi:tetratricopeptide (TPR) repeat protein
MRQTLTITLFFFTLTVLGQKAPLPPKPPQREKSTGRTSTQSSSRMYGEQVKTILPKFEIPISASTDTKSVYYFKTIEDKLSRLDTTITPEQIISLTKFNISKNQIVPKLLDSLANKTYKLNEEEKYDEAIKTATTILTQSPNNISGHKEIGLAYKRIGKDSLSNLHFSMLVKIITSVFKYGDGTYEYPFLINNFFEGISIYEAAFRCKPNKMTVMLDKKNRLLGAYNGYSSAMDEILIRYSELTHWKSQLKEGEYIKEQK